MIRLLSQLKNRFNLFKLFDCCCRPWKCFIILFLTVKRINIGTQNIYVYAGYKGNIL